MPKITNTADEPVTSATLLVALPGGIEAQERRGQSEFVASSQLPAKANERLTDFKVGSTAELYEKLGIKVIGESSGDKLFLDVELPEGWRLEPTEHSMWNQLLDDKQRTRGSIFYKAAFYDRSAHFCLARRFSYSSFLSSTEDGVPVGNKSGGGTHYATWITDSGKPVHLIAVRHQENGRSERDEHEQKAENWLNENHPEWRDYFAYWD